jgi:hypothetical protein
MSAPVRIRHRHILQKLLRVPDFQRSFDLLLIRRASHVCAVCSACAGSPSAGSRARQEDGRPLGQQRRGPGLPRHQREGGAAAHRRVLLTEQSFVPLGPQVSALLPHATTDGCVPCAGRGHRGTPCAPACGQYACLSPSACVSSDCVCDLCAVGSRGLVGPPARAGRQNLSGARARAWLDLGPISSQEFSSQVDPWSRQGLLPACWGARNNRELSLFLFAQIPPPSRHELAPSGWLNCHPGDGANPPGCLPVAQTLP